MAERKPAKKGTQKSTETAATGKTSKGFTDEEQAAMKERTQELKAEARASKDKAVGERAVLAKIAEMQEADRAMAERLHAIVAASAPALAQDLVRDARVCQGQRQDRLQSAQVQDEELRMTFPSATRRATRAPCGRSPSR